jgi:hypothetical protein
MSKLSRLYEMPRPKGTWSAPLRAALLKAKESGQPFTVKQFADWMHAAGGATTNPMSIGPYLKRLSAERSPDALHPLKVHMPGRRGPGGTGTFIWALGDRPFGTDPAPKKEPTQRGVQQEPGEFDDDEAELAAMGFNKVPDGEPAGEEPTDAGEFSSSDDEDWDDAQSDAPESEPEAENDWIPQPDGMGSYAESSMEKLAEKGFGPDNDIWQRIAQTTGDVASHALIRKELPIQLQRPALAVAKQIFQNLGKDWEGGGKESLSRLYRIKIS